MEKLEAAQLGLHDLPEDCIALILSFCEAHDLVNFALTSSSNLGLVKAHQGVWQTRLEKDFNLFLEVSAQSLSVEHPQQFLEFCSVRALSVKYRPGMATRPLLLEWSRTRTEHQSHKQAMYQRSLLLLLTDSVFAGMRGSTNTLDGYLPQCQSLPCQYGSLLGLLHRRWRGRGISALLGATCAMFTVWLSASHLPATSCVSALLPRPTHRHSDKQGNVPPRLLSVGHIGIMHRC
jgi:hypothetical protein